MKFYEIMRMLNSEQEKIVKQIVDEKKNRNDPLYVLVIGGANIGKTFTIIEIFQSLIHLYNMFGYDPTQLKGIITTYIGKKIFNFSIITLYSTFHLWFNKSEYTSLKGEKLYTLTKYCGQLCVLLNNEAYLIGSTCLYLVEKFLHKIKHTSLTYFGNIDVIFLGDLFQA